MPTLGTLWDTLCIFTTSVTRSEWRLQMQVFRATCRHAVCSYHDRCGENPVSDTELSPAHGTESGIAIGDRSLRDSLIVGRRGQWQIFAVLPVSAMDA